ncbi:MAG TPA: ABC transporter ATP-binding protein [Gemmatimonadaceae bacterium]|nr:ABC transporter ATP-binding protein [Gemmatimonadaceae bacterium]
MTVFDSSPFAVETTKLSKSYEHQWALDHIDLRVPNGAVYVLVGANGAGKSTTFKLLMNLERPDFGNAAVFGLDTRLDGPRARALIGYVPEQQDAEYRWMTSAQLLQHVAAYYPSWDAPYADRLAKAFDLRMNRKVGGLSKGEKRRLQLVMAMAHRPALLLLDEPTEGLDPVVRRQLLTLISEHLADSPTTIVIATHHVSEVENLADHIGALSAGKLVAQMSRDDLQRNVKRYRLQVQQRWALPEGLLAAQSRTSRDGQNAELTVIGNEAEVIERLTVTGARVHDVQPLTFDDATLALLSAAPPPLMTSAR